MSQTTTPVTDRLVARLIQRGHGCEKNARQVLEICLFGDGHGFAAAMHTGSPRKPACAAVVAHSLHYHKASTPARCESDAQALIQEWA